MSVCLSLSSSSKFIDFINLSKEETYSLLDFLFLSKISHWFLYFFLFSSDYFRFDLGVWMDFQKFNWHKNMKSWLLTFRLSCDILKHVTILLTNHVEFICCHMFISSLCSKPRKFFFFLNLESYFIQYSIAFCSQVGLPDRTQYFLLLSYNNLEHID